MFSVFFFLAYYLGIIRLFYFLTRRRQRILVFHHIFPDNLKNDSFEQKIVCSSQSHFDWLIAIVNKRFEVTTRIGKPDSAIITFDDGYRAALVADKVLRKYRNKAYFFVPISNVSDGPLWVDVIMGWIAYVPDGEYSINGITYNLISWQSRQEAYDSIIDSLYNSGGEHQPIIDQMQNICPFSSLEISEEYFNLRFRGLTYEEIEMLKQYGHKIGGHSVNHDILSLLEENELADDFNDCSLQIGRLFNTSLYAYPFGHKRDVNMKCIEICSQSGFSSAVMNEFVCEETRYTMSRINISRYRSRYEVEAELSGFKQWLRNLLKWEK